MCLYLKKLVFPILRDSGRGFKVRGRDIIGQKSSIFTKFLLQLRNSHKICYKMACYVSIFKKKLFLPILSVKGIYEHRKGDFPIL